MSERNSFPKYFYTNYKIVKLKFTILSPLCDWIETQEASIYVKDAPAYESVTNLIFGVSFLFLKWRLI